MAHRILAFTGIVIFTGCAMSGAVALSGAPKGRIAPGIVLLDTTVSAPSKHLLDDFGPDPSKARSELMATLAECAGQHFRGAKVYLVGPSVLDSSVSYIREATSWVLRRPSDRILKKDFGDSGSVLILTGHAFQTDNRPMGIFESFWYFDSRTHTQGQQKTLRSQGVAGLLDLRSGKTEWIQKSHGYADYSFALTRQDWTRAFSRRLQALGESNGSNGRTR